METSKTSSIEPSDNESSQKAPPPPQQLPIHAIHFDPTRTELWDESNIYDTDLGLDITAWRESDSVHTEWCYYVRMERCSPGQPTRISKCQVLADKLTESSNMSAEWEIELDEDGRNGKWFEIVREDWDGEELDKIWEEQNLAREGKGKKAAEDDVDADEGESPESGRKRYFERTRHERMAFAGEDPDEDSEENAYGSESYGRGRPDDEESDM